MTIALFNLGQYATRKIVLLAPFIDNTNTEVAESKTNKQNSASEVQVTVM
jgi:hypothetical protein